MLGVPPCGRRPASLPEHQSTQFELLGLKWLPKISTAVAKELTPYEVGHRNWRSSVHTLSSGNKRRMVRSVYIMLDSVVCTLAISSWKAKIVIY